MLGLYTLNVFQSMYLGIVRASLPRADEVHLLTGVISAGVMAGGGIAALVTMKVRYLSICYGTAGIMLIIGPGYALYACRMILEKLKERKEHMQKERQEHELKVQEHELKVQEHELLDKLEEDHEVEVKEHKPKQRHYSSGNPDDWQKSNSVDASQNLSSISRFSSVRVKADGPIKSPDTSQMRLSTKSNPLNSYRSTQALSVTLSAVSEVSRAGELSRSRGKVRKSRSSRISGHTHQALDKLMKQNNRYWPSSIHVFSLRQTVSLQSCKDFRRDRLPLCPERLTCSLHQVHLAGD